MSSDYTVVVQGREFLLSRAQIEFDSPNMFTRYFSNSNPETNYNPGANYDPRANYNINVNPEINYDPGSNQNRLRLSRDADLFMLILDYLSGYTIIPLTANVVPSRMSRENALRNLRADAEYYELQGLMRLIDAHIPVGH
jgi:hypothetical protein